MKLKYFGEINENEVSNFSPLITGLLQSAEKKYDDYMIEDGTHYTIFSALSNEHDEAHVHSKIIFFLLTREAHSDGHDDFLKLFLRKLGISENLIQDKWTPFREKYFDNGRIDFVIESKRFCIAIEMKIDAKDSSRQLERYEEFCKKRKKEYLIFYLTLDGRKPTKNSIGNMNIEKLRLISFKKEIDEWLCECLKYVNPLGYKHSFLMQYSGVVKHISKGDDKISMKEYITNAATAKAALIIFSGFMEKMENVLINFMTELKNIIVRETGLPTYLDQTSLEQFYSSSGNTWPGSYTEIDSIKNRQNEYCFVLKLEIEHSLYACLGFVKKDKKGNYEWQELADMKKKQPDFYNKWINRTENLHLLNTKRSSRSVWFYLNNSNGEIINFKEYSISAIELIDESHIQSEYIGDNLVQQVLNKLIEQRNDTK